MGAKWRTPSIFYILNKPIINKTTTPCQKSVKYQTNVKAHTF